MKSNTPVWFTVRGNVVSWGYQDVKNCQENFRTECADNSVAALVNLFLAQGATYLPSRPV